MRTDLSTTTGHPGELTDATVDVINDHLANGGVVWFTPDATRPRIEVTPLPDGWRSVVHVAEVRP